MTNELYIPKVGDLWIAWDSKTIYLATLEGWLRLADMHLSARLAVEGGMSQRPFLIIRDKKILDFGAISKEFGEKLFPDLKFQEPPYE